MKVALSFITIGEGKKCLVYKKIDSIEEYNATNKKHCDKCESYEWNHMNGIKLSLLKMEISIYYVMDVLSSSRI